MKTYHWLALTAPPEAQILFKSCTETKNPAQLWVQGSDQAIELLGRIPFQGLAIVGTRFPERRSLNHVESCLRELSQRASPVVISGMARGIDTHAHSCALRLGLPTIAVLGGSINDPYPRETYPVRKKILESNGLVISETPLNEKPHRGRFIQRNRLIAAWSQAVWVVQAHGKSGALGTASWARKMGRDLYVTPCFPGDPTFAGNDFLFKSQDGPFAAIDGQVFDRTWEKSWERVSGKKFFFDPSREQLRAEKEQQDDSKILLQKISEGDACMTQEDHQKPKASGPTIETLLNWGIESGLTPDRMIRAIQLLSEQRQIFESNGRLLKNPAPSE
ncbi:MAG: DNA-processing protein DprA [Bdellovibrionales bacterium]|nr:DNA-processing protein DprA [Bdellovibrionales bacterium]